MNRSRLLSRSVKLVLLAFIGLAVAGCRSPSGSREYIPGKGWRSTQLPDLSGRPATFATPG